LPYYVRLMHKGDLEQVKDIDREAFPTQWPPPNYQRELENKLARHVVVCEEREKAAEPEAKAPTEKATTGLAARVKRFLKFAGFSGNKPPAHQKEYVLGFAGIWVMAEEAHITNIAVRNHCRRKGIGELLLITIIELAAELKASVITLEVRISNTPAQQLYHKYGFNKAGVRRGYYTDNREDGLLMSTEKITSAAFQARFQELKQASSKRHGKNTEKYTLTG
jgi:ribosomal-protein-alanine N-acetyltransferase